MPKFKRKFRPGDDWYIAEHESWFADMAKEGLFVRKVGVRMAKFEQGEPRDMEYRIAVKSSKTMDVTQIELYEAHGWDYVTSYRYFQLFAAEAGQAREIEQDQENYARMLKTIEKKLKLSCFGFAAIVLLYIGLTIALLSSGGTPILTLVEGHVITQMLLACVFLANVLEQARGIVNVRRLQQRVYLHRYTPWRKQWKLTQIYSAGLFLFAFCAFIIACMQLVERDYGMRLAEEIEEPYIRIVDIEQYEHVLEIDGDKWYSTDWSILAPLQYEVNENGVIKDSTGHYVNDPSIETNVYALQLQLLARPLVEDLVKWHTYPEEEVSFVRHEDAYFEELLVLDKGNKKEIIAASGKVVLYARYYGEAELERLLEQARNVVEAVKAQ